MANKPTPADAGQQEQGTFTPPLIEKLGLETRPSRDLCHYTSQAGLIGMLASKTMYATDATYLNDSQEIVYAVNLAKRYFKNQQSFINSLDRIESLVGRLPAYVASFSEEPDLLSQWRGYCTKGSGFALCLSPDRMIKLADAHRWSFFKCLYDEKQQIEVLRRIEEYAMNYRSANISTEVVLGLTLLGFSTAFKHPKFEEESEWRALRRSPKEMPLVRPGTSTLVPYINFPLTLGQNDQIELSRLVVGPAPHAPLAKRAAKILLQSMNVICPEPVSSEVPFRNW